MKTVIESFMLSVNAKQVGLNVLNLRLSDSGAIYTFLISGNGSKYFRAMELSYYDNYNGKFFMYANGTWFDDIIALNSDLVKSKTLTLGASVTIPAGGSSPTYDLSVLMPNVNIVQVTPLTNMVTGWNNIRPVICLSSSGYVLQFVNQGNSATTLALWASVSYV